jgi:hypothetical protein
VTTDRSQCALAPADREAFFPDLIMNPLTTFEACEAVPALPAADLEIAKDFVRASKAAATRRVYQKDFARFTAWCDQRRIPPIPAAPLALTGWPTTPWSGWSRRAPAASDLIRNSSPAIRSAPAS